ncbi:hypothetical protein FRB96_004939 [Tulasnella sp. 330]|nr:hypothetical protein FRB96_004939 [Tulasnella sp. 330]
MIARSPHRPTQHPYASAPIGTTPPRSASTVDSVSSSDDSSSHLAVNASSSSTFPHHSNPIAVSPRPRTLAILERRQTEAVSPRSRASIRSREEWRRHGGSGSSLGSLSLPPVVNASSDSRQDAGPLPPISSIVSSASANPSTHPPRVSESRFSLSSSSRLLHDIELEDAEAEDDFDEDDGGSGGYERRGAGGGEGDRHGDHNRDWDHHPSAPFPTLPSPIPPPSYPNIPPQILGTSSNNRPPLSSLPPPPTRSRSPSIPSRRHPQQQQQQHHHHHQTPSPQLSQSPSGSGFVDPRLGGNNTIGGGGQGGGGNTAAAGAASLARPHVCPLCPLAFTRAHDLKRHTMTHTGEKRFKCTKCGKAYGRKDALKRHACSMTNATGASGSNAQETVGYGAFMGVGGAAGAGTGHRGGIGGGGWTRGALESPEVMGEGEAGPSSSAGLRRTATWSSRSMKREHNDDDEDDDDGDEDGDGSGSRRMASPRARTRSQHPTQPHHHHQTQNHHHQQRVQLFAPPIVGAALAHMQNRNLGHSSAESSSAGSSSRPTSRSVNVNVPPAFHPPMRRPSISPTSLQSTPSPPPSPLLISNSHANNALPHPHPPTARQFSTATATSDRGRHTRPQPDRRVSEETARQRSPMDPTGSSSGVRSSRYAQYSDDDEDDEDDLYSS